MKQGKEEEEAFGSIIGVNYFRKYVIQKKNSVEEEENLAQNGNGTQKKIFLYEKSIFY